MKSLRHHSRGQGLPLAGSSGGGPGRFIFPHALPLGGLVLAVILEYFFPVAQGGHWFPTSVRGALAVVFFLGGFMISAGGYVTLRRAGTSSDPRLPALCLVETGPFSWTRNPMDLGDHLMFVGVGLAARIYWTLLLLPLLHAICHCGVVWREESHLRQKFGRAYLRYTQRVRRWI